MYGVVRSCRILHGQDSKKTIEEKKKKQLKPVKQHRPENWRKMLKKPVINEELCTGCGICVDTCGHDVLELKDDKAVRARPEDCDGAGVCAGVCPSGAITLEER